MIEDTKELWDELQTLLNSYSYNCDCHNKNTCPDGNKSYLHIDYQYSKKHPEPMTNTLEYLLKTSLRAIGHRLTKKDVYLLNDLSAFQVCYVTSITEEEHKTWLSRGGREGYTYTEHYLDDSDSDTESEVESDVESEAEPNNDDNPN